MRWRDIRFEKPTKADADKNGDILQLLNDGKVTTWHWKGLGGCIAWAPLSELPKFDPIPDPPEGWRFVDKEKDKRRNDAKCFNPRTQEWYGVNPHVLEWTNDNIYIVPIDPPASLYRPFANFDEWWPHRNRYVKRLSDGFIGRSCWDPTSTGFQIDPKTFVFLNDDGSDGEPCGVKVSP